jgi:Transcriptional regulatory protein, C terminal
MSDAVELTWQTLPNPFNNFMGTSEPITGHVSGRSKDIIKIITGGQSAIIVTGAPRIGKSALVRDLQRPPHAEWSWRNELADYRDLLKPDDIHFVQIDLTPLEDSENVDQLLVPFVEQCILALQRVYKQEEPPAANNLKGLRELLRSINRKAPNLRFFVMLDSIERLDRPDMQFDLISRAKTPQERGIALLNHCGAIRALVDLIDEFTNFGALIAIESLPRPKMVDQFTHVSADLARFTTMTLQAYTWEDTSQFLAQDAENFGSNLATMFKALGGSYLFSEEEQTWLAQQAGTHPYLLQQFCFWTFYFKQAYASARGTWTDLHENDKSPLLELINDSISTFLTHLWKRLEEAMEKSSQQTQNKFYEFMHSLSGKQADEVINGETWNQLGSELRYILCNEGVVRSDPFQLVHYPGATLCRYLSQKASENNPTTTTMRGFWLTITCPDKQPERVSLSELEYLLLKTLIQYPNRRPEEELMKGAWGKVVDRSTFTQRMHSLRKKLKERCGTDLIENHYGGQYSLHHSDWFDLE